ncbi:MAG: type I-U CRISPR-associated protein Cas5/Cas6 [Planctomycetes bacterium]|nr:type I-U CRISPR-associated protein Cas5/Cas6 [Planctomycetota bacterium]
MVSIAIRFLAGRYHATGWDHHVNEGVPEWPPAPFRILRALTAASYRVDPPPTQQSVVALLQALSGVPEYCLPAASQGHTRHYMPIEGKKTTKVFDSFVAIGDGAGEQGGEIVVTWPQVELDLEQSSLLERLLAVLGYLGRAESWVECKLLDVQPGESNARPLSTDQSVDHETQLLACESPSSYESWRRGYLAASPKGSKVVPPESLWDILHTDTGRLQSEGWSSPPGTRWIRYGFDRPPFRSAGRGARTLRRQQVRTVARYALHSAVLPRIVEAVAIGERMRQALMSHSRDEAGISHAIFSGRDAAGVPLKGQHHAFYLPEDMDSDGFIDHILVWARDGFDERCERALHSVERLWASSGHELWLVLANLGTAADLGTTRQKKMRGGSPSLGPARLWRSATPFVAARHTKHRKGRWIDTPEEQLRRALELLGLPPPEVGRLGETRVAGAALPWYRFRRRRLTGGGSVGDGQGHGFELTFPQPVFGPIAAGYGAHFGLGRFEAIE